MTFAEFLQAPREGALMDALRAIPKRTLSDAEVSARAAVDTARDALKARHLTWAQDRCERRGTFTKKDERLLARYDKAMDALMQVWREERESIQRRLYDNLPAEWRA